MGLLVVVCCCAGFVVVIVCNVAHLHLRLCFFLLLGRRRGRGGFLSPMALPGESALGVALLGFRVACY